MFLLLRLRSPKVAVAAAGSFDARSLADRAGVCQFEAWGAFEREGTVSELPALRSHPTIARLRLTGVRSRSPPRENLTKLAALRMPHSYEEIRSAAVDILAGREGTHYNPTQYASFETGVAEVLERRKSSGGKAPSGRDPRLDNEDADRFREVFWDLFRQSVITIGLDRCNNAYPFFSLSAHGKRILENQDTHFYHDVTSYEARIRNDIPDIDELTLLYAKESMQAYRAGCMLSSTVMLGVATEHVFDAVLDVALASPAYGPKFRGASKERAILNRVTKFKKSLDGVVAHLSRDVREDLDTHFAGILSIIRNYRNQSGHPSGLLIGREQCYILLQLFIPYCRKLYQVRNELAAAE